MTQKEDVFDFPCRYPVKAMGRAEHDLIDELAAVVRRHAELAAEDIATTPSRQGNYLSVTMTITAESRAQLEAIYTELRSNARVLMTL